MSQHTHTWLHPPYWSPQGQPKPKHELTGWQQMGVVFAALLMPFLIPVLLNFLHLNTLIYLAIVFVLSIPLRPFPKSFLTAIGLSILPFAVFYGASVLNPLGADFKDVITFTVLPYAVGLMLILTTYYGVILNMWEARTRGEPKDYWFSIAIASVLLMCLGGLVTVTLRSQNATAIFVSVVLALFIPFFPPVIWVSTQTHHVPHITSALETGQSRTLPEDRSKPNEFAPYSPTEFYLVGFFLSLVGTTALAIVNARRMGDLKRAWPIVLVALFIILGMVFLPVPFELWFWLWFVTSIIFVIGIVEWQKPVYYRWLEARGNQKPSWAERGGWMRFGMVIGVAILSYYAVVAITQLVFSFIPQNTVIYISVVGCIIAMLGPAAYDLFHHEQLKSREMWLYTIGWLLSASYASTWILTGVMAGGGDGILFLSSVTYAPMVIAALILGWILFKFRHYRLARVMMILPLVNVILYVISYLSLIG